MKRIIKSLLVIIIFLVFPLFLKAQPHPNGGDVPGSGNTPVGGGAPIGGGLLILASFAMGYSAKKVYKYWKAV